MDKTELAMEFVSCKVWLRAQERTMAKLKPGTLMWTQCKHWGETLETRISELESLLAPAGEPEPSQGKL